MPAPQLYADVLLPLHLPATYTYAVPADWQSHLVAGARVVVQFGKTRMYTGLVWKLHKQKPTAYTPKPLLELLDEQAFIPPKLGEFWTWLADYYLCFLGDVMQAALPSVFRIGSETIILRHPDLGKDDWPEGLDEQTDAGLVLQLLRHKKELRMAEIQQLLQRKTVMPLLRDMVNMQWVVTKESLAGGYREKRESFYQLAEAWQSDAALAPLCDELETRAPKQMDVLMQYLVQARDYGLVPRADLLGREGLSPTALNALLEKGILVHHKLRVDRLPPSKGREEAYGLSPAQSKALTQIEEAWAQKNTVLLHGITGSGKTLLYIELIKAAVANGRQVLYMVPEITLTAQLIERLRRYLGTTVGVFHSRFTDDERAELWQQVHEGRVQVVLGARSSLFLPFERLGLIVVDEEHDPSYKQTDPAPRYHARDAALWLAREHQAKVLLGSATPSVESWQLAQQGKYALVSLSERFGGVQLPDIQLADIRTETRDKLMKAELTGTLYTAIQETLAKGEQVILFQNRRGYVPYTECADCGWSPECVSCDITLTYHKLQHQMRCHYCGYKEPPVPACKACGSTKLVTKGFGTERVEEAIAILFPEAAIARLDLDATRKKHAFADIIRNFEQGKIDILIGTQMVTKGLDFDKVTLVGVLNADQSLRMPDFRANERTFQLLEQVSGRAGRREIKGRVIIQTREPGRAIFKLLKRHDYHAFAELELTERSLHSYPPYTRLIHINLRHREQPTVTLAAQKLGAMLVKALGERVKGPATPVIERIRDEYHRELLIKMERDKMDPAKVKAFVKDCLFKLETDPLLKGLRIYQDVDPY
ncbi:MAG: primosomal protein N' [Bacteroidia bacterium]